MALARVDSEIVPNVPLLDGTQVQWILGESGCGFSLFSEGTGVVQGGNLPLVVTRVGPNADGALRSANSLFIHHDRNGNGECDDADETVTVLVYGSGPFDGQYASVSSRCRFPFQTQHQP